MKQRKQWLLVAVMTLCGFVANSCSNEEDLVAPSEDVETRLHVPATMSSLFLQNKLRSELGYQNIIITDGMEMGAITKQYTTAEAAVGCVLAGVDIVLCPLDFRGSFDAIVKAVEEGTLSEERINQSVRRILKLKKQLGR